MNDRNDAIGVPSMGRLKHCLMWCLLLVLAGCGGGGSGDGGSNTDTERVDAPTVSTLTIAQSNAETVTLAFDYADINDTELTLILEYSLDGGSRWSEDSAVSNRSLMSGPEARAGTVTWTYQPTVGFHGALVRLRLADALGSVASEAVALSGQAGLRAAAKDVDSYMIYYTALNDTVIDQAKNYDLAIVHPFQGNITADEIDRIQRGNDPTTSADDVIVLCYISVGEDSRTFGLSDAQMLSDTRGRFTGDGTGPVTDPRGPAASGSSLVGLDVNGLPSSGGTGFAPYYLDDNDYDGSPDRNGNFDVAFVNAGHPAWFDVINGMTFSADGVPGLREMLSNEPGLGSRGLGCDGLFLDTIDTAAPNSFTDETSANQSEFEWTAGGFRAFIERLRTEYPNKLILQNRGLFYFNPVFEHYKITTGSLIDFVLFESYRLDSSSAQSFNPYFAADNKFNFRPRLMAEAQREDGFTVLSLGYAEGPPGEMDTETLLGEGVGFDLLIQDIVEAEQLSGFRHYITDEQIVLVNDFVRTNAVREDTTAPSWNATFNANNPGFPTPPGAPDPRVGIQQAVTGPDLGSVVVRWDLAMDYNQVQYQLYYQTEPFNFATDPDLTLAQRLDLQGVPGAGYSTGPKPSAYANEALITDLEEGQTYYFVIRARDAAGNVDQNQQVLSAMPLAKARQFAIVIDGSFTDWDAVPLAYQDTTDAVGSDGPDWLTIKLANDNASLSVLTTFVQPSALNGRYNIFIDADQNPDTGFRSGSLSGLGADFLVQGTSLYSMATGEAFSTSFLRALNANANSAGDAVEISVALSDLGVSNLTQTIGLVFVNDGSPGDFAPEIGAPLTFGLAAQ
ncbi:MAG: hypothetical protein AB8C46_18560 [Burkholderiaceae bacterium]